MATKLKSLLLAVVLPAAFASPAMSQDVETTFDEEWITLSGKLQAFMGTSFVLDYGDDAITIELDKFDWAVDKPLAPGDQVTVTGRMDMNLYDYRTIEAATVYIPRLNEYVYANPVDEEGDPSLTRNFAPGMHPSAADVDRLSFTGRVVQVDEDAFTVDTGASTLRIDTDDTSERFLPTEIGVGDRVWVSADISAADLFDERVVDADLVTKLSDMSL